MEIIATNREMQARANLLRQQGKRIVLVPTMGYLHEGHLSLIRRARACGDVVVVSIYVNPTQFGPQEDFEQYPRDFKRDEKLAAESGTDIIFAPTNSEMYPENFQTFVQVEKVTQGLCGASRPVHFRGVATIVTKLFHIVKPHVAVFGQKDAQQSVVIKQMVADLNMDIDIEVADIVREPDGVAMSSRNKYLSPEERKTATILYSALLSARKMIENGNLDSAKVKETIVSMIESAPGSKIDYVEITDASNMQPVDVIHGDVFIALAVYFGKTRLLDNIKIRSL